MNENEVRVSGNLTTDVELKHTRNGKVYAQVVVACNNNYMKDGVKVEQCDFFPVDVWGANATNLAKYMSKGDEITVKGRLRQNRWETNAGEKRSRVLVVASNIKYGRKAGHRQVVQQQEPQKQVAQQQVAHTGYDDLPY